MCNPQPPSYPFWLLVIKDFGPFVLTPFAALLGFWFACRRDDRNIRQTASIEACFWKNRVLEMRSKPDYCTCHLESLVCLQKPVIHSSLIQSPRKRRAIQKAWDDYRTLNPQLLPDHDFHHEKGKRIEDVFDKPPIKETGYEAITRTLSVLINALAK